MRVFLGVLIISVLMIVTMIVALYRAGGEDED
jgi:hypothetical protein